MALSAPTESAGDGLGCSRTGGRGDGGARTSELEAELARATEELEELRRALARSERLQVLGEYVTAIVHDLNNVLASASSALRLIGRATGPGPLSGIAGEGMEVLDRGASLVRQMLDFARGSSEETAPISASQVLEGISGLIRSLAGPTISVEIAAQEDIGLISTSSSRLESVILNLTANARDAMPEGGRLTVSVRNAHAAEIPPGLPPGDFVRLDCVDTGEGMKPETLAKAGQPFFTTKRHGTGLGLAGAFKFAEATGGQCVVASTLGEGSAVTLFLVRSDSAASRKGQTVGANGRKRPRGNAGREPPGKAG